QSSYTGFAKPVIWQEKDTLLHHLVYRNLAQIQMHRSMLSRSAQLSRVRLAGASQQFRNIRRAGADKSGHAQYLAGCHTERTVRDPRAGQVAYLPDRIEAKPPA